MSKDLILKKGNTFGKYYAVSSQAFRDRDLQRKVFAAKLRGNRLA